MTLMPFTTVAPPVLGMVGAATALYYAQSQYKVFGGVDANTLASWRPEHKEAERQRMLNMEREASLDHKVILNPHRHNILSEALQI